MRAPGQVIRVLVGGQEAAHAWMRHHGIAPGGPAAPLTVNSLESARRKLAGLDADRLSVVTLHDADPQVVTRLAQMAAGTR